MSERPRRSLIRLAKNLRRDCTNAEWLLWQKLRRHGLAGLKVRRQHQLGKYIVDFYCPSLRLIVEVDGGIHQDLDHKHADERRSRELMLMGHSILRFKNEEVERQLEQVMLSTSSLRGVRSDRATR